MGNPVTINTPSVPLTDLIGDRFDCLRVTSVINFYNTNIAEKIHTDIEAPQIHFQDDCVIDGVSIKLISSKSCKIVPSISIGKNCPVHNTTIESDISTTIHFNGIPNVFKNVKSSTITNIRVENREFGVNIFENEKLNNLFEFGYKLGYRPVLDAAKYRSMSIDSLTSLEKLCKSNKFHSREYDQVPYRLKKGARLSDVIDISKFKSLKKVVFCRMPAMEISFEHVDRCKSHDSAATRYPRCVLTSNVSKSSTDPSMIFDEAPITEDGWRVIISTA